MTRRLILLAATSLFVLSSWSSYAQEWLYTVRPGDEIWNIASKYCGSAKFAARIAKFNQISNERGIRPGQRLRIPVDWLVRQPAVAQVLKVRGQVVVRTPAPRPAKIHQDIEMGHVLTTQEGSALVGFADGSTLNVGPESEVLFNVLTAYGDTGMVDTNLRFYRGRGTSKIIRRNDASHFRISTPVGTAAVRGTEFRVAVGDDKTLTETLEGSVGFIQTSETSIPQGFGASASAAGVATEPLLPAPLWRSAAGQYAQGASLSFQAVSGAKNYRVIVFQAQELDTPLQEFVTSDTKFDVTGVSPGSYIYALRGISGSGIEGFEAKLNVDISSPSPIGEISTGFSQSGGSIRWSSTQVGSPYTMQIAQDDAFDDAVIVVEVSKAEHHLELPPGNYFWRVKDSVSLYSEPLSLRVRPNAPSELRATNNELQLMLSWAPNTLADSYRVRISRRRDLSNPLVNVTTEESSLHKLMPAYGRYYVEVVSVSRGIESEAAVIDPRIMRQAAWWHFGLFALPFLL